MPTIDFTTTVALGGCGCTVPSSSTNVDAATQVWRNFCLANPGVTNTLTMAANHYATDFGCTFGADVNHVLGSLVIAAAVGTQFDAWSQHGTQNLFQNSDANSAYFQSCCSGVSAITLVTPGDASKYSIGDWVLVTGLAALVNNSGQGYPPSWQRFEYHQITNKVGSVLSLDSPLKYSYSSTWARVIPETPAAPENRMGGPAMIIRMENGWNNSMTVQNIEILDTRNVQTNCNPNRTSVLQGCKWNTQGLAVSMHQSCSFQNCIINTNATYQQEIDKCVEYLEYTSGSTQTGTIFFQNPIQTLVFKTGANLTILGTGVQTLIDNSSIYFLHAGSEADGRCDNLTLQSTNIGMGASPFSNTSGLGYNQGLGPTIPPNGSNAGTKYEYRGGGVFRIPLSNAGATDTDSYAFAIPGFELVMGYSAGGTVYTQPDSGTGAPVTFCVTDQWDDGTYFYFQTSLTGSTLPSRTFNTGHGPNIYFATPFRSITSTSFTGSNIATAVDGSGRQLMIATNVCSATGDCVAGGSPSPQVVLPSLVLLESAYY